ncbi:TPA: hypothetical protein ACN311_001889 [Vibrio parahaemolyticus]
MENIKIGRDILVSHIAVVVTVSSGFFYLLGSLIQEFYLKSYGLGSSEFSKPVAEHISIGFMHFITVPSLILLFFLIGVSTFILRIFRSNNIYIIAFVALTGYLPVTSMISGSLFADGVRQAGAEVNVCTNKTKGEHCYCGKMIIQDASKLALLVGSKAYVIPFGNINYYYVMQEESKNSCTIPAIKTESKNGSQGEQ